MQSERWQSCTDIFNAAIEHGPAGRAALLTERCNGDATLRRGVELLLKYYDHAGDFIEAPAFQAAPDLLVADPKALVGQHLKSYRIDAMLGAGGMGVVYLAYDERLGRKIALKLLPGFLVAHHEQLESLKREARTASALNHPNIVTIHEVGEVDSTHFIATEFVEGVTLRERIAKGSVPLSEALDIAIQIASALAVAHRCGIVHRDIKPENIMLRPDGYVKVLDFGIAKFIEPKLLGDAELKPRADIVGTARYMSPEQARGETVDARTDLWSLGAVLYEVLGNKPPFEGETRADVLDAIRLNEPRVLAPSALQKVVSKALRKDPSQRYETAEKLLSDLRRIKANLEHAPSRRRWIAFAAAALLLAVGVYFSLPSAQSDPAETLLPNKSIAVLPFENLTGGSENAFLADAIQDDVVTGLAKIKDLKVIARSSVQDYRSVATRAKLREIGRSLGVAHLLQGSVRQLENSVVVNVALVDTRTQEQKWAQHYERTVSDASRIQGEVAADVARELRATLTPSEAMFAATKPTQNPQAYLLYLRARELEIADVHLEHPQPALQLYQQAVELDRNFALAHARISRCASDLVIHEVPGEWKARARAEAEEALRLAPDLGEAHLALTHSYLWGDRDYERALLELNRTAELLPNSPEVPLTAAYIYKRQNRLRERIAALRRAETLDPRNLRVLGALINTLRWIRDWPEAMQSFDCYQAIVSPEQASSGRCWRAEDEFRFSGDINVLKDQIAHEASARSPASQDWLNFAQYEVAVLERNYSEAARFLAAVSPETFDSREQIPRHSKAFFEALLAVAHDTGLKQEALEAARKELEKLISMGEDSYGLKRPHNDLAVIYAFLGRKEDALEEIERGKQTSPPKGSIEENDVSAALAMVYAHTGEPDKAIDLIEHLLTMPVELQDGAVYNMTLTDLKWRWEWDPLRSNPRFQKILADPEPKTVY